MLDVCSAQVITLLVLGNFRSRIEMRMLRNLMAQSAEPLHALGYAFARHRRRKRVNKERRLHIMLRHPTGNPLDLPPNTLIVKSFSVERQRGGSRQATVLNYAHTDHRRVSLSGHLAIVRLFFKAGVSNKLNRKGERALLDGEWKKFRSLPGRHAAYSQ